MGSLEECFRKEDLSNLAESFVHTWINSDGNPKICVIGTDFNARTYIVEKMQEILYKKGIQANVCSLKEKSESIIKDSYAIYLDPFLASLIRREGP
ncbi:MAG: hypothetical protein QXD13_02500 [Candidatus Pacearchaeota archaeon]